MDHGAELMPADYHVTPIDDLREHETSRACWCEPTLQRAPNGAVIVVHNSADGRELVEEHGLQ